MKKYWWIPLAAAVYIIATAAIFAQTVSTPSKVSISNDGYNNVSTSISGTRRGLDVNIISGNVSTAGLATSANQTNGLQKTQIVDTQGGDMEVIKENDLYSAAYHGPTIYGIDRESTPSRYHQLDVDVDGHLRSHQLDVSNNLINPATSDWQQYIWSAITGSTRTVQGGITPSDTLANPTTAVPSASYVLGWNSPTSQWKRVYVAQPASDNLAPTNFALETRSYMHALNGSGTWDRINARWPGDALTNNVGMLETIAVLHGYNGTSLDRLRTTSTPTTGTLVTNATLSVVSSPTTTPHATVTLGNSAGKTNVFKTGSLTTTAITADQIITAVTYTVTAGKVFYMQGFEVDSIYSTPTATSFPTNFGTASMESPAGTKIITNRMAGIAMDVSPTYQFAEPIPFAAGTGIWVKVTPASTTSTIWQVNYWGYEK